MPLLPPGVTLSTDARGLLGLGLTALALAGLGVGFTPPLWRLVRRPFEGRPLLVLSGFLGLGDRFVEGLARLRRLGGMPAVLLLTLASWVSMYSTNLTLAYALGIEVPPSAGLLVTVLVFLAIIPRLMPGQVGPFYFFARLALEQFSVAPEKTVAYAVFLHALFMLPPLVGAGLYLLVGARRLRTSTAAPEAAEDRAG